jgi:hypothetical protein
MLKSSRAILLGTALTLLASNAFASDNHKDENLTDAENTTLTEQAQPKNDDGAAHDDKSTSSLFNITYKDNGCFKIEKTTEKKGGLIIPPQIVCPTFSSKK